MKLDGRRTMLEAILFAHEAIQKGFMQPFHFRDSLPEIGERKTGHRTCDRASDEVFDAIEVTMRSMPLSA